MDATAKDPAYRAPEKDNDAFNAELAKLYGAWDEAAVLKRYEQRRLALIELVINLPDETYDHKEVQAWIKSDVIDHYFEHAI